MHQSSPLQSKDIYFYLFSLKSMFSFVGPNMQKIQALNANVNLKINKKATTLKVLERSQENKQIHIFSTYSTTFEATQTQNICTHLTKIHKCKLHSTYCSFASTFHIHGYLLTHLPTLEQIEKPKNCHPIVAYSKVFIFKEWSYLYTVFGSKN